jgi:phosphosulfolactate synthase
MIKNSSQGTGSSNSGEGDNILNFITIANREPKPRENRLTHVLDKGLGIRQMKDLLETAGEYIDIVKLGWGTGYVTRNLAEKVAIYQEAGIPVCFGGTLLEVAIAQGKFEDYCRYIRNFKLTHVEFSTGVLEMDLDTKVDFVSKLAQDFIVLAEVGSKDPQTMVAPELWVKEIDALLRAGAWKVIAEARESGTVGLYSKTGDIRSGLVDEIFANNNPENLIFEAPQKQQQVWFLKHLGPNANLGNIATDDVIPLETLRLGLRCETIPDFQLNARKP